MLSRLERRQKRYCVFGKGDVNLSHFAEYRKYRRTFNLKGWAVGLRLHLHPQEKFTKWMAPVFPLLPSLPPPHPHSWFFFFFLIGFDFQHFVRSSALFVSSFEQFYMWLCVNLFTLVVPFILFVMCGQHCCIPLWFEEQREETYSCGLRYASIAYHFWMGFIFLKFR